MLSNFYWINRKKCDSAVTQDLFEIEVLNYIFKWNKIGPKGFVLFVFICFLFLVGVLYQS